MPQLSHLPAMRAEDSPLVRAAQNGRLPDRFQKYAKIRAGMNAPPISASRWHNTDQPIAIGTRPLLINFWSMTCLPCVEHLPQLEVLAQRYRSRLTVVSVHPPETSTKILAFIERHRLTQPIAIDTGVTRAEYGVTGVPTYVLVAASGEVLLKSHRPPSDHIIRTTLGLHASENLSPIASIARKPPPADTTIRIAPIQPGERFRGISASRWFNTQPLDSNHLKGRVLLIDFWATWCLPCTEKLPQLQALADQFGGALTVIGVHYESDGGSVERFLRQNQIRFPVALDEGGTWDAHSISYLPTYLLIDAHGVVRYKDKSLPDVHLVSSLVSAAR